MSKHAMCQVTRKQDLRKGEYTPLPGGNIHFEADGTIYTLGTKQDICIGCTADKLNNKWFIDNTKWISEREHKSTGAKSEKVYQLTITLRNRIGRNATYTHFEALSVLSTKYLFSIINVRKNVFHLLSCKYRKYQKLSKVIDQLQEYFDVLDYSIREYDENEGTVRYFTSKAKNVDTIRTLQESRATNQWNYAWTTSKKTRPEDKRIKLAE